MHIRKNHLPVSTLIQTVLSVDTVLNNYINVNQASRIIAGEINFIPEQRRNVRARDPRNGQKRIITVYGAWNRKHPLRSVEEDALEFFHQVC